MLYINVTYNCKPGKREAFYRAIREHGIDAKSQAENGCSRYEFFSAIETPDRLFLAEAWENRDVHAAHKETAHFKELQTLKAEFVESVDAVRVTD